MCHQMSQQELFCYNSSQMDLNGSNLCRLCFEDGNIHIFDENGRSLNIAATIKQHLDCEVCEYDAFPKCVCSVCWNHIRSFHRFYEFVRNAQATFVSTLIKDEHQTLPDEVNLDELVDGSIVDSSPLDIDEQNNRRATRSEEEEYDSLLIPVKIVEDNTDTGLGENSTPLVKRKKGRPRKNAANDNTVKTVPPEKVQDDYSNSDETVEESEQSDIESDYNSPLVKRKRGKPKIRTITVDDDGLNAEFIRNSYKQKGRAFGEISKERSTYFLSKDYEDFMLENFDMSCDRCPATDFKSFFDVKTHYMSEHKTNNGFVSCCNRKFIYIGQCKDHIDYHLNPEVHRCKICNRRSKSKAMLQRHMKEHEEVFSCDICGFKCGRKPGIFIHMVRKHVPIKPDIKCEECHKAFSDVMLLDRHIRVVHTKQIRPKRTTCEICGKSVNAYLMGRHNLIHMSSEERLKNRWQCEVCSEWFYSYSGMYQHRLNHAEPVKCDLCNKEFVNKSALMQHVRRMHENLEHKCPFCNRAYHMKHLLKLHMESHTRDKQYPCSFCSKVFQVQKSRATHYSRHHRAEFEEAKRQKKIERFGGP